MTVGMSAPPMGVTSMMPKISATPIMMGKRYVNSGMHDQRDHQVQAPRRAPTS